VEFRDTDGQRVVSLGLLGYQFARHGERYDDNWLVVRGEIVDPRGAWAFQDPCLLTFEAAHISPWLRRVAAGREPFDYPDERGNRWPSLSFMEPNISFGVSSYSPQACSLRVHFSLESAAPSAPTERQAVTMQHWIELQTQPEQLLAAADAWDRELTAFPERT
jgi:hypothetical protein